MLELEVDGTESDFPTASLEIGFFRLNSLVMIRRVSLSLGVGPEPDGVVYSHVFSGWPCRP